MSYSPMHRWGLMEGAPAYNPNGLGAFAQPSGERPQAAIPGRKAEPCPACDSRYCDLDCGQDVEDR